MGVVNDLHNLRMDMISALSNPQYNRDILETLDELAAGLNGNSCALECDRCSSIYLGSGECYTILLGIKGDSLLWSATCDGGNTIKHLRGWKDAYKILKESINGAAADKSESV